MRRIDEIDNMLALEWCKRVYFDNGATKNTWRYAWNSAQAIIGQYCKGCW